VPPHPAVAAAAPRPLRPGSEFFLLGTGEEEEEWDEEQGDEEQGDEEEEDEEEETSGSDSGATAVAPADAANPQQQWQQPPSRPPRHAPRRRPDSPPAVQRITSLRLEHCTGLDAKTVAVIAGLPWLRRLAFLDCPDLTEDALLALARAPRLLRIEVLNCAKVGGGAREGVRRARERALRELAASRGASEGGARADGGGGGFQLWAWPSCPNESIDLFWEGQAGGEPAML
jgi:hypothetical protein